MKIRSSGYAALPPLSLMVGSDADHWARRTKAIIEMPNDATIPQLGDDKVAQSASAHYDAPLSYGEKGSVNPRPAQSTTP